MPVLDALSVFGNLSVLWNPVRHLEPCLSSALLSVLEAPVCPWGPRLSSGPMSVLGAMSVLGGCVCLQDRGLSLGAPSVLGGPVCPWGALPAIYDPVFPWDLVCL